MRSAAPDKSRAETSSCWDASSGNVQASFRTEYIYISNRPHATWTWLKTARIFLLQWASESLHIPLRAPTCVLLSAPIYLFLTFNPLNRAASSTDNLKYILPHRTENEEKIPFEEKDVRMEVKEAKISGDEEKSLIELRWYERIEWNSISGRWMNFYRLSSLGELISAKHENPFWLFRGLWFSIFELFELSFQASVSRLYEKVFNLLWKNFFFKISLYIMASLTWPWGKAVFHSAFRQKFWLPRIGQSSFVKDWNETFKHEYDIIVDLFQSNVTHKYNNFKIYFPLIIIKNQKVELQCIFQRAISF